MKNIRIRFYVYIALLALALGTMYLLNNYSSISKQADSSRHKLYRDLKEIRQEGKLRLIAPYSFISADSIRMHGIQNIAFVQDLSQKAKAEVLLTFEDNVMKSVEQLLRGDVDLVLSSVEKTTLLDTLPLVWIKENIAKPLFLVQRVDSTTLIKKHSKLNHKSITIPLGSPYRLFVNHLTEDLGLDISIVEDNLYNTEQLITLVNSGKVEYTICDGDEAEHYKSYFPHLDFSLPMSHALRKGWLARSSSPVLIDSLRVWLN